MSEVLSVIVPTFQRREDLTQCLRRLAFDSQSLDASSYEVIVSDDGQDTLAEYLKHEFPWVRYQAGPRRGPAANRNSGAKAARGTWVVFVDDDCLPSREWLSAYWSAIQSKVARVLEGKTRAVGPRPRADMESPENTTGGYLWSCNMAIEKQLFLDLGGFDEQFPGAAMEDVELHWRLKEANIEVQFVPEAEVGHPWRIRKGMHHIRIIAKSIRYYVDKHPKAWQDFSARSIISNGLRRFATVLYQQVCVGCLRGLGRELCLLLYAPFAVFRELYLTTNK